MANANAPTPLIGQNLSVPIGSPNASNASVSNASQTVLQSNIVRRGIIFTNPSASVSFYVIPSNLPAVIGQGFLILPGAQLQLFGDGKLINYNCGWNAIASVVGPTTMTILEFL